MALCSGSNDLIGTPHTGITVEVVDEGSTFEVAGELAVAVRPSWIITVLLMQGHNIKYVGS